MIPEIQPNTRLAKFEPYIKASTMYIGSSTITMFCTALSCFIFIGSQNLKFGEGTLKPFQIVLCSRILFLIGRILNINLAILPSWYQDEIFKATFIEFCYCCASSTSLFLKSMTEAHPHTARAAAAIFSPSRTYFLHKLLKHTAPRSSTTLRTMLLTIRQNSRTHTHLQCCNRI